MPRRASAVPPAVPLGNTKYATEGRETMHCPICGAPLERGAPSCSLCGTPALPLPPRRLTWLPVALVVVGAAVLLVVALLLVRMHRRGSVFVGSSYDDGSDAVTGSPAIGYDYVVISVPGAPEARFLQVRLQQQKAGSWLTIAAATDRAQPSSRSIIDGMNIVSPGAYRVVVEDGRGVIAARSFLVRGRPYPGMAYVGASVDRATLSVSGVPTVGTDYAVLRLPGAVGARSLKVVLEQAQGSTWHVDDVRTLSVLPSFTDFYEGMQIGAPGVYRILFLDGDAVESASEFCVPATAIGIAGADGG